ncbi:hypothetical protein FA15DRAFT_607504, partial [Coprinopsis marcescibilis]
RVKNKGTAKEVWDAIANIFEDPSKMVAIDYQLKLQGVKCGDNEDVRVHFNKMSEMNENLASYRTTLGNHEYAFILVGSLPPAYNPTLSSILAAVKLNKAPLSPDVVIDLITDEYD